MLRLIYKGAEVVLSAETSIEYYRENPFFSKEGSYTLDIDIDLNNKVNAQIFAGVKRLHLKSFSTSGECFLYDGIHLICKGTATVLSKDGNSLKLQILSDNSELNYVAKASDKVRDLDLGSANYTRASAADDLDYIYPQHEFAFPNIKFYDTGGILFLDGLNIYGNTNTGAFDFSVSNPRLSPQPFVLNIISRLIDCLGYRLNENFIADDIRWRRLIMINPYLTDEYAKMLPDWTVSDALTEFERFFNALFIVDSYSYEASFVSLNEWYESTDKVVIDDDVLDSFDITFNGEDDREILQSSNDNIVYAGLDNLFWKAAKLSNDFISRLDRSQTVTDYESFDYYIDSNSRLKVKWYGTADSSVHRLYQIGQYQPFVDNSSHDEVSLKIFPAEIVNSNGLLLPCVPSLNEADNTQKFWDVVNDGQSIDETRDYMNVAFYVGSQYAKTGYDTVNSSRVAPCCITDYHSVLDTSAPIVRYAPNAFVGNDEHMTLELNGPNGRGASDFRNNISIDDSRLFTISFAAKSMPDPMKIFVIKGRQFICRKLKCTYTNHTINKHVYEGEFYAML